jgi:PAS domain S-box-containing protein
MAFKDNHEDLTYGAEELKKETRQRKKAETALRRTEALASALLNASADSAILVDARGSILAINEFALKNLSQPNANVIHQNIFDLLPPDVTAGRKARAEEVIRTGEPIQFEDEMAGRVINNTIYPVFGQQGSVTRLAIYSRDITDYRQAEEMLRESEAKFRMISASAQDAIIMMDSEGKISYWNEAAERIFIFKKSEAMGQDLHETLVPQKYIAAFRNAFSGFKITGDGAAIGNTLELTALRKGGIEFPIELSLSAFKFKNQWQALGIVRDISDRKLAEKERVQKEKLKGVLEMAGAASHELNQPLQVISGYAELLLREFPEDHPHYEYFQEIKEHIDRLGEVTRKIMRITKYETLDYINGVKIIDIHKASKKK